MSDRRQQQPDVMAEPDIITIGEIKLIKNFDGLGVLLSDGEPTLIDEWWLSREISRALFNKYGI